MLPPLIDAVLSWIGKFTPRYAVVLGILTALLLFAPAHFLAFFGLVSFTNSYRGYIALVFGFCLFLIATYLVEHVWKLCDEMLSEPRHQRKMEQALQNLGLDQVRVLLQYVESRKNSVHFSRANGAVWDLVKKGILYPPDEQIDEHGLLAFNLTPLAQKLLRDKKFQDLLVKADDVGRG